MVTECAEPLSAQLEFRRNDLSATPEQFAERFIENQMPSDRVLQQNVKTAIDECKRIDAVQYCTHDGELKIIDCGSRPSREVHFLIRTLDANITKSSQRNTAPHCSFPMSGTDVPGESHSMGWERRPSPYRSSDSSDSSSSHGSDAKRKRQETDESVSSGKERRRRKNTSRSDSDETSSSSSSQEPGLDEQHAQTVGQLGAGNGHAVHEYIVRRFKDLQQNLCKAIAKPWIKIINPNKQTNHPYAGGTGSAPWWWPKPPPDGITPTLNNGFVRHKEPDHLKIQERLTLLPRILYVVISPPDDDRGDEIRKISLNEFKRMTFEQISDKLNDANHEKRLVLDDIFEAAFQLQRYKEHLLNAGCKFAIKNFLHPRRDRSREGDDSGVKSDDVEEEEDEMSHETNLPVASVHLAPPSPDARMQHGLPDPAFPLNSNHTTLGSRHVRIQPFHPQAATEEPSYGPSYSLAQGTSQDLFPARMSGNYPHAQTLQEPQRMYQGVPQWYVGASQYLSNAPVASQLMDGQPAQCHPFSSTLSFPLPQGGSFLPPLPLPAISLPPQDVYTEGLDIPRACQINRLLIKEDLDGRADTLRLPYRPHNFQDYSPNPLFSSNPKQHCESN